ncbi:MAG: hypothetical protein ACQETI_12930 [Halobacteriota archaeon]
MSSPSAMVWFKHHSVLLVTFVILAVAALIVPPVVLGEMTPRTYAITAAVVILAVSAVFPYAMFVALGTLPFLYAGSASFAAPQTAADVPHPFSTVTALRHVVAGIFYVLAAAAVGAIWIAAQIGVGSDFTVIPAVLRSSFLYFGGVIIAGAFSCLQLWRYDTPLGALARRTILETVALGILLALSPVVALWMFNGGFY